MIRERQLASVNYTPGGQISVELPKDAVYHQLQFALSGRCSIAYGTGSPTACTFAHGFPFNLIARLRLIRNGSDVVWQGSGKQLAKECLYLNKRYSQARMWGGTTSTTLQTLLLLTVNGVSVPANSEGIGANVAAFQDGSPSQNTTQYVNFKANLELWLQLGVEDKFYTTLVDARPLASFNVEITWAAVADVVQAGTLATPTFTGSGDNTQLLIMSYDQDNVQPGISFGTFKRSSISQSNFGVSSADNQVLLSRGNFYYGLIFETLIVRSSGLTTIASPGNDIITTIQNRINSNYSLRQVLFSNLQAKNRNNTLPSNPYDVWSGGPLGWAFLDYTCVSDEIKDLVPTFTMDQFDLLISTGAGTEQGAITGNPILNFMLQEVIPGESIAPNAPRGAFAGSQRSTSAKAGGV